MKKVYLIAGEYSGDFIGSKIMKQLKNNNLNKFRGIGGNLMIQDGLIPIAHIKEINLLGFFEILPHIFKLRKLIKKTIQDIINYGPDILITIDSPSFTYRIVKALSLYKKNFKIIHIVAPSVWIYNPNRAKKYSAIYDHLLTLLPFEPQYFENVGLKSNCIGHPILEQRFFIDHYSKNILRKKLNFVESIKIICITPGSRIQEIKRHIPILIQALNIIQEKILNLEVICITCNIEQQKLIESIILRFNINFKLHFMKNKLEAFAISDLAIAKSGTNTIEIAASNTPMIVIYKLNYLSFLLIKLLAKIHWISLINIIAEKTIIPELIQHNCNPTSIANEAILLLQNEKMVKKQTNSTKKIIQLLGFNNKLNPPSSIAVKIIMQYIN